MKIGVLVSGLDVASVLSNIRAAEDSGLECAWMTSGGTAPDPLTIFAVAAAQTQRINLGTAIIQTFPRHPLALVQQALVIDQLAPGRLRLGVGPSGPMAITPTFGIPFERPQEHLREYVQVLRNTLAGEDVNLKGKRISARAKLAAPTGVTVMASALRASAFRVCGEVADGAISWLCPPAYLVASALPALAEGAETAGRPIPPLIAHLPVVIEADPAAAREAVRKAFGFFPRVKSYQDMFIDAGFPEAAEGAWSDAMVDAAAVHGSAERVEGRIRAMAGMGFSELMVSLVGGNSAAALELLGGLNRGA